MDYRASRAKCHAGGGPLERRVRPSLGCGGLKAKSRRPALVSDYCRAVELPGQACRELSFAYSCAVGAPWLGLAVGSTVSSFGFESEQSADSPACALKVQAKNANARLKARSPQGTAKDRSLSPARRCASTTVAARRSEKERSAKAYRAALVMRPNV
jgi:hypothetical protein